MVDLQSRPDAAPSAAADAPRPGLHTAGTVLGLLVAAVICGAWSVPAMRSAAVDNRGLLFAAGPGFATSLVMVTLAFAIAIRYRHLGLAAGALVTSVLLVRLPTALGVDLPLYSWTYKHFGVIDYISVHGSLARGADIYHSWPGMFAFFAWLNDLTGSTSLEVAHWFTPGYQLALTGAVFVLARCLGLCPRVALVAAFLAHTANWVGQDYFSPQAVAMLLALGVLALVVRWPGSRLPAGTTWVALVVFAAITVTHQLTPYWLLVVMAALALLGMLRPWWAVGVFTAVAIGYLAANYDVVQSYGSLLSVNPLANAQRNVNGSSPSAGQVFTSWCSRLVSVAVWGGAGLVLLRRLRRLRRLRGAAGPRLRLADRLHGGPVAALRGLSTLPAGRRRLWATAVLSFGAFALLLGQGYGGEAIFRVFLYSLPGCAILLAPGTDRLLGSTAGWWRPATATAASVALMLGSAQAFYGAWFPNRVDADALQASVWIIQTAPPDTMVIALAPGAPGRVVARYVDFARINRTFDGGVNAWTGWLGSDFTDDRVERMTTDLRYRRQPTWVVMTSQMKIYNDYYGLFPPGALDRFESQLLANPHWITRVHTATLTVVELDLES
ncbi:hypothetical protein [Propionicimonas sp.]|uniref:hypothetical protein n=1 Tax=Propionicimonas sp. TaxID=1955623 RepID=UPI0039E63F5D